MTATASGAATTYNYPVILGYTNVSAGNEVTTKTESARISGGLFFSPNLGSLYVRRIHSNTAVEYGRIVLGNGIADGTAGACEGRILIYGKGSKYIQIIDSGNVLTADRTLSLPDVTGTIYTVTHKYSIAGRTTIAANANLNTNEFTACGKYQCPGSTVQTLTNCPISSGAIIMEVENTTGTNLTTIENTASAYRRRVIYSAGYGNLMYVQIAYTTSAGVLNFSPWYQVKMEAV